MSGTQVKFYRKTLFSDSQNSYQILANCTVAGALPDTGIFLLNIVTANDPKDDTLTRIVQVGDFDNYETSRSTALNSGDLKWRSSMLTLVYTDIEEAEAAAKELSARINTLVETFDEFKEAFETAETGLLVTYPTFDPNLKDQYVNSYKAAVSAVAAAESTRDSQAIVVEGLKNDLDVVNERVVEAQGDLTAWTVVNAGALAIQAALIPTQASLVATLSVARNLVAVSDATSDQQEA